jgi:hypothetical protein
MHDALARISETFPDADLSIVKEVLYFDGWSGYEECGGYLIFVGIDDTVQLCEYGYSVMAPEEANHFSPREITEERSRELIAEMDACIEHIDRMSPG